MIIGITGTNGAGKGTVVEYLKQKGFVHYSVRDFLNAEISKRGLQHDRGTMLLVANELRAAHGPGYIAEQLLSQALAAGKSAVIESVRSIGEAQYLKEHSALLWAIDADMRVRYERILGRMSETDKISYEKFVADESAEIANAELYKPNLRGVIAMADAVFTNDGTPQELYQQVDLALNKAGVE
jgi:dephospho-CoA kinase